MKGRQLTLQLYELQGWPWMLPQEDLFTALLLECGPLPDVGAHEGTPWFWDVRDALRKYFVFENGDGLAFRTHAQQVQYRYVAWLKNQC